MTLSKPQRPGRSSTGRQLVSSVSKFGRISRALLMIEKLTPKFSNSVFPVRDFGDVLKKTGCDVRPCTFDRRAGVDILEIGRMIYDACWRIIGRCQSIVFGSYNNWMSFFMLCGTRTTRRNWHWLEAVSFFNPENSRSLTELQGPHWPRQGLCGNRRVSCCARAWSLVGRSI
jgi:hypothetical protein